VGSIDIIQWITLHPPSQHRMVAAAPDVVHPALGIVLIPRKQHILLVVAHPVGVVAEVRFEDGDLAVGGVVVAFDDGAGIVGQGCDVEVGVVGRNDPAWAGVGRDVRDFVGCTSASSSEAGRVIAELCV